MTSFHHSDLKINFRRWSAILNHCDKLVITTSVKDRIEFQIQESDKEWMFQTSKIENLTIFFSSSCFQLSSYDTSAISWRNNNLISQFSQLSNQLQSAQIRLVEKFWRFKRYFGCLRSFESGNNDLGSANGVCWWNWEDSAISLADVYSKVQKIFSMFLFTSFHGR